MVCCEVAIEKCAEQTEGNNTIFPVRVKTLSRQTSNKRVSREKNRLPAGLERRKKRPQIGERVTMRTKENQPKGGKTSPRTKAV